jgi:hypothetical protein
MRTTAAITLALGLLLTSCSSVRPVAIHAGELCYSCGRPITNIQLAAEAVSAAGQFMKFRTVGCMAKYLTQHPDPMQGVFVTDYQTGRMVRAQTATFVRADIDDVTHERDYYAFIDVRSAVEFGQAHETSPIDWLAIMQQTAASRTLN